MKIEGCSRVPHNRSPPLGSPQPPPLSQVITLPHHHHHDDSDNDDDGDSDSDDAGDGESGVDNDNYEMNKKKEPCPNHRNPPFPRNDFELRGNFLVY